MSKTKIFTFILAGFLIGQFLAALPAAAQQQQLPGAQSGVKELSTNLGAFGTETGLGGQDADLKIRIARIINIVLGFLGVMAVIMIIAAGFKWMMAGGNEETVAKAKRSLWNAALGALVALSAYALTYFIINTVAG